jgi:hypothetical protein
VIAVIQLGLGVFFRAALMARKFWLSNFWLFSAHFSGSASEQNQGASAAMADNVFLSNFGVKLRFAWISISDATRGPSFWRRTCFLALDSTLLGCASQSDDVT